MGASSTGLDLFKSLVVLWIVNTVNELIHLRHIIHQNPLYVPICPETFPKLEINFIRAVEIQDPYQAKAWIHHFNEK